MQTSAVGVWNMDSCASKRKRFTFAASAVVGGRSCWLVCWISFSRTAGGKRRQTVTNVRCCHTKRKNIKNSGRNSDFCQDVKSANFKIKLKKGFLMTISSNLAQRVISIIFTERIRWWKRDKKQCRHEYRQGKLTWHGVVNTWPVLAAVPLQPNSDCSVKTEASH